MAVCRRCGDPDIEYLPCSCRDDEIMSDTTDALESLIAHPGWRLVQDIARREWTEKERAGRKSALNDTDDKRALDKLRQITAAQEAVEWVLALPSQELGRLKRQEQEAPWRDFEEGRGPRPETAGMSRRGSL